MDIVLLSIESDINGVAYSVKAITLSLAAVFGLVSAVKIFNRWQGGHYDNGFSNLNSDIVFWVGSFIFFVLGRVALEVIL